MAQQLKYIGGSHFRTITTEEFAGVDLEDVPTLGTVLGGTVTVKDKVAEYLLTFEPGQWEKLEEPADSPASSAASQDAPKKPVSRPTDAVG